MKERKYVDPNKAFVVHPDITEAFLTYNGDPDHFKKTFDTRNQRVDNGQAYHNDQHDEEMTETARERSQIPGWTYPRRKKK